MARRKIPISLIPDGKKRATTYGKRKEGLRKKAKELSTLCNVPIAFVCAGEGESGTATTEVWESEPGVLDKYRALPPEVREKHTHRRYLEGELGKERAKLARVRADGALELLGSALNGITVEEAQELLESIDAAMVAARERREALYLLDGGIGVNDDDGCLDLQHIPPGASDAAVVPVGHGVQYIGSSSNGNQRQTTPAGDGINDCADQYGPLPWVEIDTFQPHVMPPGHGFQCAGDHYVDMDGYLWQAPHNAKVHNGWPDLATWCTCTCTDESCLCNAANAGATTAVPARYPPTLDTSHVSFLATPAQPLAFSIGSDFMNAPDDFLSMGVGGSFINVGDYSEQCSADGFQLGDANNLDQLHYLVGGTGGAEPSDTQSQNWGN